MCSDGNLLCLTEDECPEKSKSFPWLGTVRVTRASDLAENYNVTSAVVLAGTITWRLVEAHSGKLVFITCNDGTVTVKGGSTRRA